MLPAGMLYGALVYGLGCYWLYNFYPAAMLVAMAAATLRFGPLFIALKFTAQKRYGLLAAAVFWAACDTISSIGFLAFPYLTLPYALYTSGLGLFIASLGGMSLLSLCIALLNSLLFLAIRRWLDQAAKTSVNRFRLPRLTIVAAAVSLIVIIAFQVPPRASESTAQLIQPADASQAIPEGMARVALLQPSTPHPQKTVHDYYTAFLRQKNLSDQLRNQTVDLVVWHETAVVPPIGYNLRFRDVEPDKYAVVRQVHDYLIQYPHPVVLGNGWSPDTEEVRTIRENVALLYQNGSQDQKYTKMKLVPFSENFPFENIFPKLSAWLEMKFDYFWHPGTEFTILNTGKVRFAAPICFEDSFGPHFIKYTGADFYVVLTQDAWAKSVAMQKQHKSMSIFRAAESGSIVLRVGNTGYTAAILPGGKVAAELTPMTEGILLVDVATGYDKLTVYEKIGKYFDPVLFILTGLFLLLAAIPAVYTLLDKKRRL